MFKYIFYFIAALGGFAFIIETLITIKAIYYPYELPLGNITSIHVDSLGSVYLALGNYGYIQKYSNKGKYITKWSVGNSNDGDFLFFIKNKKIHSFSLKRYGICVYDLDGKFLEKRISNQKYDIVRDKFKGKRFEDELYMPKGVFNRRIIKCDKQNNCITIIKMNYINQIFIKPFSWLLLVLGVLGSMVSNGVFRRKKSDALMS